jgi:hypothetical protein
MNSLVDSTLNIGFNIFSNYYTITKKNNQEWLQINLQHWNYFLKYKEKELTLYFSLRCMDPSRFGVGLSYEIQIQCACDRLLQYDNFVDKLQSLFKFFNILIIFMKSNSHTTKILNILNLSKTSCAMLRSSTNSWILEKHYQRWNKYCKIYKCYNITQRKLTFIAAIICYPLTIKNWKFWMYSHFLGQHGRM